MLVLQQLLLRTGSFPSLVTAKMELALGRATASPAIT